LRRTRIYCKTKKRARDDKLGPDAYYLSPFVIPTRWADRVSRYAAAALRALVQLRCMPAMAGFARAQSHLRRFAFWDSHGGRIGKQELAKRQIAETHHLFLSSRAKSRDPVVLSHGAQRNPSVRAGLAFPLRSAQDDITCRSLTYRALPNHVRVSPPGSALVRHHSFPARSLSRRRVRHRDRNADARAG
jgi:hypothetical protein